MSTSARYQVFLILAGLLFFVPGLGAVHLFDWDEINFAEISREMIELQDYLRIHANYKPFWEKPPLFFWLQVISMKIFGVNEFAARLPNALCGIASLLVLFRIGRRLYSENFGLIWALVYLGSVLPHLYFRSGIIDPVFNLFIFSGLYYFILFVWKKRKERHIRLVANQWTYLFWAGFLVGMAILTKGPVAYLVICLSLFVYWIGERFRMYISVPQFLFFSLAASLVTLSWYGLESWRNGSWFITEFNRYQYRLLSTPDAGHVGFPGYHFAVLLVGCFPASIFAIRNFFRRPASRHSYQQDFRLWMIILFWVVLILFSLVQSKIVHYSSLCYFPLTFLAALSLQDIRKKRIRFNAWMEWGLIAIGSLYILVCLALPWLGRHPEMLEPLLAGDPFGLANLQAEVHWSGWEIVPGIWLFLVLTLSIRWFRKGHFDGAISGLFVGTAIFITLTLFFYINRIEAYSQRAAIEFFKSKVEPAAYVQTYGYKSYGQLFYTRKPPVTNPESYEWDWLMSDAPDRPVYAISKIHKAGDLEADPRWVEIERKNGFVMFVRKSD